MIKLLLLFYLKRFLFLILMVATSSASAEVATRGNCSSISHRHESNLQLADQHQLGLKVIHVPFVDETGDSADCFDVCYSKGAYCLEFYDKTTGLEFPCGKGEGRNFPDRLGAKQYAQHGDVCICLQDHQTPNITPFPDCTPKKPCD